MSLVRAARRYALVCGVGVLCVLTTGLVPLVASASVPYQKSDVFAAIGGGKIGHYSPTGVLLETLNSTSGSVFTTGMCFDAAGDLFTTNFNAGTVSKFDNAGNLLNSAWATSLITPESCVRDMAGNFYVGQANTNEVVKYDPKGTQLARYVVAADGRGADWIDLAADQCTLYYTSEGPSVKRFNVCTGVQLADFATNLPRPCYALRIRSNGEVMVACGSAVQRLSSNGLVTQTYSTSSVGEGSFFFALNLDPDGTSFWTGGFDSNVYRLDILTGRVITHFTVQLSGPALAGLAVFGEQTAATPPPSNRPVIFVPGIGGSQLRATRSNQVSFILNGQLRQASYQKDDILWLDQTRVLTGLFDQGYLGALQFQANGTPMFNDFKADDILNASIAGNRVGYPDVVNFFTSNGYTRNQDFFVLPYDWRYSADANVSALDALVLNAHAKNPGSDGVDIVAHSMGTQVTRAFLTPRFNAQNTGLVRHVVLLGSPQLGTPKGTYTTISGVCLPGTGGVGSCAIPAATVKAVFQTIPGGLDQAVSSTYRQVMDGSDVQHPLPFADLRSSPPVTDYNSLVQRELSAGTSQAAITQANNFHSDDATWIRGLPYNVAFIAGTAQCTLGQITENYVLQIGPLKLGDTFDYGEIDGDGTVVRKSATLDDGRLFSNPNVSIYYRPGVQHGALAGATTLGDALALLRDKVLDHGPMVAPMNCKALSVHSPMELQVTDGSGHRLGATIPGQVYSEIAGANYDTFADMKVVTFNTPGTFTATLTGTGTGEGTVKLRTITQDGVQRMLIFPHVPATTHSKGTLVVDAGAGTASVLNVDVDGDGKNLVAITPFVLSNAAARDTTPPSIAIIAPFPTQAGVGLVPIQWSVTDDTSGVASSAAVVDAGSPSARRLNLPGPVSLPSGVHTLDVFAEDRAGNPAHITRDLTAYSYAWLPPLGAGFSGDAGRTIPVKFNVQDLHGNFVADTSVVVDVLDSAGSVAVPAVQFAADPDSGVTIQGHMYHANVRTGSINPGQYVIRARFSSPTLVGELDLPVTLR